MQSGDRGLNPVQAGRAAGQRDEHQVAPLLDHRAVPAAAVLVIEQHELAIRTGTGVASRVGQQHQREQPGDLPLGGQQPAQDPCQPDGLLGEVEALQVRARAGRVPLGED